MEIMESPLEKSFDELLYGTKSASECEKYGMMFGCPGCPVLERGDCDNPDAQQYLEALE